jgi:hypothetical protein
MSSNKGHKKQQNVLRGNKRNVRWTVEIDRPEFGNGGF